MKKRRGIERFFVKGSIVLCPDCGQETIFQGGSLLGDLSGNAHVSEDVIERLYTDCCAREWISQLCSECEFEEDDIILWIEVDPGALRGPLCVRCFYECLSDNYGGELSALEDARVFSIKNNTTNQKAIDDFAATSSDTQRCEDIESEDLQPTDLF